MLTGRLAASTFVSGRSAFPTDTCPRSFFFVVVRCCIVDVFVILTGVSLVLSKLFVRYRKLLVCWLRRRSGDREASICAARAY